MFSSRFCLRAVLTVSLFLLVVTAPCQAADDPHDHAGHDHAEVTRLYGNHLCPTCGYEDLVDPHFFVTLKNPKAKVYARIYVCEPDCGKSLEENLGKSYLDVYRTDRKTGERIPPRQLRNEVCPVCDTVPEASQTIEYNGLVLNLCQEKCLEAFLENPDVALEKLLHEDKTFDFEGHLLDSDAHDHEGHDHEDDHDHDH